MDFSVVYGPTVSHLRDKFLHELRDSCILGPDAVLICGDFNLIRNRSEKVGKSYNYVLSNRFNKCISDLELMELGLNDRRFTWSRSVLSKSQALLDRFLCSTSWHDHFRNSGAYSLPRVQSYHNPIIVNTNAVSFTGNKTIKFEKDWLVHEGFSDLLIHWWNSYHLSHEVGNSWRIKLQFMRQKLRGWNNNLRASQRKTKKKHLLH